MGMGWAGSPLRSRYPLQFEYGSNPAACCGDPFPKTGLVRKYAAFIRKEVREYSKMYTYVRVPASRSTSNGSLTFLSRTTGTGWSSGRNYEITTGTMPMAWWTTPLPLSRWSWRGKSPVR
jgi:hypothetical protein